MFEEVKPIGPDADAYASVDDLTAVDDMPQVDVRVRRWGAKSLKLRVRGPNLDEQDAIHQEALVKNAKTSLWEEHRPSFCAATLQRCVTSPQLDAGQAKLLRKKNPAIIEALVNFIWALPAFGPDDLEKLALDLAPTDESAPAGPDAGDPAGAE